MICRDERSGMAMRIGRMLAQCRRRDNLTQSEAAIKVGVNTHTLASWEQGRFLPDAVNLLRLLRLYRIEPEQADGVLAGDPYIPSGG